MAIPLFGSFGKSLSDLLKKKFDDKDSSLHIINKNKASGLTVETVGVLPPGGALRGYVKLTRTIPQGKLEGELHTDSAELSKVIATFDKAAPGLKNVLTLNSSQGSKTSSAVLETEFVQDQVAAKLKIGSDLLSTNAEASLSAGYNNFVVGGSVSAIASDGVSGLTQPKLKEIMTGAEYTSPSKDYVFSLIHGPKALTGSYFQRVNRQQAMGAQFSYDTVSSARSLIIGSEYQLDPDTLLKGKVVIPSGSVHTAVEHRLPNNLALISVAASFRLVSGSFVSDKVGVSASVGDF